MTGLRMTRLTTIDIDKEYLKFSAAHFTVFSADERERLHGHNFRVSARFIAPVNENGMCVDYSVLKKKIQQVCDDLDEFTLIAANSPYLKCSEQEGYYQVEHDQARLLFLIEDTLMLPIANTTVEELSWYVLNTVLSDQVFQSNCDFQQIDVWVSSGPGQKGKSSWFSAG